MILGQLGQEADGAAADLEDRGKLAEASGELPDRAELGNRHPPLEDQSSFALDLHPIG